MGSRVYFQPQGCIVVVEVVGAVTTGDLDDLRRKVVAQQHVTGADRLLVDLSRLDPSRLSSEAVRSRAEDSWETFHRIAQVAPADLVFGLARMYDLTAGDRHGKTRASFRSRDEAEQWLCESEAAVAG